MDYTYIEGFHGGTLVYLHAEDNLFHETHNRNGQVEYNCYESILPDEYSVHCGESANIQQLDQNKKKNTMSGQNLHQ